MNEYTIFRRVPGGHPRWHAVATLDARSRPDALRRLGLNPAPRQNAVGGPDGLRMAWRTDRIDFDHRSIGGAIVRGRKGWSEVA